MGIDQRESRAWCEIPEVPPGRVRYLQPTELRTVLKACLSGCGR